MLVITFFFLDNLFSSPELLKYLYDNGIGASGTARMNCDIHQDLVAGKKKKPDSSRQWGWTLQIPSECGKVNQKIAWQDNDMVLFLSTVHTATDTVSTLRRRPRNINTASKKAARRIKPSVTHLLLQSLIFRDVLMNTTITCELWILEINIVLLIHGNIDGVVLGGSR